MFDHDNTWKPVTKSRYQTRNSNKLSNGSTFANSTTTSTNSTTSQITANGEGTKSVSPLVNENRRIDQDMASCVNGNLNSALGVTDYRKPKFNGKPNSINNASLPSDPRKAMEKEIKALAKYEATAKNACWHFEEEIKKSGDRLKRAFEEIHNGLNYRETLLLEELKKCHADGITLAKSRTETEQQLKSQTARTATMSARDMEDLRRKIRTFLHEKRVEEELGKSLRFQYGPDKLIEDVAHYGEVIPFGGRSLLHADSRSAASLVSVEGIDACSVDSSNVAGKPAIVSEINVGGLVIQSDSMDPAQLAALTRQMQESLRMQGITDDILPEVSGSLSCPMPQRRRPAASVAAKGVKDKGRGVRRPTNQFT